MRLTSCLYLQSMTVDFRRAWRHLTDSCKKRAGIVSEICRLMYALLLLLRLQQALQLQLLHALQSVFLESFQARPRSLYSKASAETTAAVTLSSCSLLYCKFFLLSSQATSVKTGFSSMIVKMACWHAAGRSQSGWPSSPRPGLSSRQQGWLGFMTCLLQLPLRLARKLPWTWADPMPLADRWEFMPCRCRCICLCSSDSDLCLPAEAKQLIELCTGVFAKCDSKLSSSLASPSEVVAYVRGFGCCQPAMHTSVARFHAHSTKQHTGY